MKIFLSIFIILIFVSCNQQSENNQLTLQKQIDSLRSRLENVYSPGIGKYMSSIQTHHATGNKPGFRKKLAGKQSAFIAYRYYPPEIQDKAQQGYQIRFQGHPMFTLFLTQINHKPDTNSKLRLFGGIIESIGCIVG